jgi:hypothetical protein
MRLTIAAFAFALMSWPVAGCAASRLHVTSAPVTVTLHAPAGGGRLLLHLDDVRAAPGAAAQFRVVLDGKEVVQELYLMQPKGQNLVIPLPREGEQDLRVTLEPLGPEVDVTMKRPRVTAEPR